MSAGGNISLNRARCTETAATARGFLENSASTNSEYQNLNIAVALALLCCCVDRNPWPRATVQHEQLVHVNPCVLLFWARLKFLRKAGRVSYSNKYSYGHIPIFVQNSRLKLLTPNFLSTLSRTGNIRTVYTFNINTKRSL